MLAQVVTTYAPPAMPITHQLALCAFFLLKAVGLFIVYRAAKNRAGQYKPKNKSDPV